MISIWRWRNWASEKLSNFYLLTEPPSKASSVQLPNPFVKSKQMSRVIKKVVLAKSPHRDQEHKRKEENLERIKGVHKEWGLFFSH